MTNYVYLKDKDTFIFKLKKKKNQRKIITKYLIGYEK